MPIEWQPLATLTLIMAGVAMLSTCITLLALWPRLQRLRRALGLARVRTRLLERELERHGGQPAALIEELPPQDLTQIRGVGPRLAEKLNAAGVYRYEDLAALAGQHEAHLVDQFGALAARMQREEWILQAKRLACADQGRLIRTTAAAVSPAPPV